MARAGGDPGLRAGRRDGRHWVTPAGAGWTPPVCVFFDTETVPIMVGDTEVQRLRLWCASMVVRRHKTPGRVGATSGHGTTGAELAAWLTERCRGHDSVWLWAHNLGFDLTSTRLITHLVAGGWSLTSITLSGKSATARLSRRGCTLTMADSWSWLGAPLRDIGAMVATGKPPLPDWTDADAAWLARCAADVEILGKAVLELLAWWDDHGIGRWSVTGAGCGWTTIRRHIRPYSVLVDPTPDLRSLARRAIHGGRRDLCRWGPQAGGPWVQLDFATAYPAMAGALELPTIPKGRDDAVTAADLASPPARTGWVADVVVTADRPSWPARWGPDVIFPVGTFPTTLAGPELALAARSGAIRQVVAARRWRTSPVLVEWSEWILGVLAGGAAGVPAVARLAAKGWSRSALGKLAGRTSVVHDRGPAWAPGWAAARGWDAEAGAPALLLTVAGRRMWTVRDQEAVTAVPEMFAWVESAVRWRLRAVLDALGEGTWVQSDTDGCICSVPELRRWLRERGVATGRLRAPLAVAAAACDVLCEVSAPLVIRPKGLYDKVECVGPQHLRMDGQSKLAGIRSDARASGPRSWEGRTWPGLLWQMEHGHHAGYVRPRATWRLPMVTAHRWALATGALAPLEVGTDAGGQLAVAPWAQTTLAAAGMAPAPHQWRRLTPLLP